MELLKTPHYAIRHLSTIEEHMEVENMQMAVWGIHNHIEIVPKDILLVVQRNGGLALGAFDPANKMIGFLFGFIGLTSDHIFKHCSHMMGVLPEYRHHGVGENLKYIQRKLVLEQGMSLITWTVNPLEGVNASLNFAKLGVVCRTLLPNFYGVMEDSLNKGLPSDRFEVEWWLDSNRVEVRLRGDYVKLSIAEWSGLDSQKVNSIEKDGVTEIQNTHFKQENLMLEVPTSFQQIKNQSLETALSWIHQTRAFFQSAFSEGYVVTEFVSEKNGDQRRNFYILQKKDPGFFS